MTNSLRVISYEESEARLPKLSDEALALKFADRYDGALQYVAAWGKWYVWNGSKWMPDDTLHARDRVRLICRQSAVEDGNSKAAKQVASQKTVNAVELLAKADRRLAATVDQWDRNLWILNTPDGTVDLKTGALLSHNPDQFITAITAVAPGGSCPNWLSFLDRITNGDRELQSFIQRMLGYSLTGSIREHALFFGYGTGANGKSVIIDTVSGIFGDYHRAAPIETFTASSSDRHPTDLAALRGARLVTAVETEEGRRWAESKIKSVTGGDKIAARFMRQDFFEYTPQFKLIIMGNHKPGLCSVDEAIRRRFHLVPFTVTIPPKERDFGLSEKLKAEWGGILQWAIEGCLEWQRQGLNPPDAVTSATANYLEAEDAATMWMEENCERDPAAWSSSTELYTDWKEWAQKAGEGVGSRKRFAQHLEARGLQPRRTRDSRGYQGLRLKKRKGED